MQRFFRAMIAGCALCIAAPVIASEAPVPREIPIALLVDLSNGQTLYARDADRRFVPASITKVMTAYTAFELIEAGELRLDMPFLYSQELEDEWYNQGSNMFLRAGERPTVAQLLLGVTTISGNDASVALAMAATGSLDQWLSLMNTNARALDMRNTHFGSANGFPDEGATYTNARDLARLGKALSMDHAGLYRRFFGHRGLRWRDIAQDNHDPVTGRVRGADGMKTGYTREAGFTFLGSAEREGRRLIMVLAGAPTERVRDETARAFLEWGFSDFRKETLFAGGTTIGQADVQNGSRRSVRLILPEDFQIARADGAQRSDYAVDIVYRGPIEAPIAAGDIVARLQLSIDGEPVLEAPLEAAENVSKAGPLDRIVNAFASWLA